MKKAPEHLRKLPWYLPHQAWLKQNDHPMFHDPEGAEPSRADLTRANLRGADLTWADLTGANLTRANLTGADLRDAETIYALDCGDPRGYRPIAQATPDGWLIHSGCRSLLKAEALKHWGSKEYPSKDIGKRYVRAIKALPKCPKIKEKS